ncbi:hypothetical protein, partial [Henriciella aquimarina]|uniref:hypothetical protein n=1 Tax=Henriciella aquimarina TaxID=545261 RepID=UPI001301F72B
LRTDTDALDALGDRPRKAAPGPVRTADLLHRLGVLLKHLDDPAPLAARMARHLSRLRRSGALKPILLPMDGLHRLSWRAGLVAALLPEKVSAALAGWYDSG